MATVTKPIALNESFISNESPSRNVADILAQELARIAGNILPPNASQIAYDNTESGLTATNVQDAIDEVMGKPEINNSASHNAIYRGKSLGSSVTAEQFSAISDGTFEDLFIGDYWTINGVNWRIAHFDYWLKTGNAECTTHHVVIVPDSSLYSAQMNTTNTTAGGYYNSAMRGGANYPSGGNLANAKTAIDNAFGSSHILSHREMLTNAISGDNASQSAWYDSTVEIMSEVMVYGHPAWSVGGKGYETGIDKEQLALFRHDHSRICNRAYWWLRGVCSATDFAQVDYTGTVSTSRANSNPAVRPVFAIIG